MLNMHVEQIGDMAVIQCSGRIVQSDAAFKLRKTVMSQLDSRTIVLDLSEVDAIEGGGLGMLSALQRWADDQSIELKLFNPRSAVRTRLEHNDPAKFYIAPFDEIMGLVVSAEWQAASHSKAA